MAHHVQHQMHLNGKPLGDDSPPQWPLSASKTLAAKHRARVAAILEARKEAKHAAHVQRPGR